MSDFAVEPIDLDRVVSTGRAVHALRCVAQELRGRGVGAGIDTAQIWTTPLGHLVAGRAVQREQVVRDVDREVLDTLITAGVWVDRNNHVLPALALVFACGIPVVVPVHQIHDAAMVYIGLEAPWLVRLAWKHGPPEGAAADLATGTGIVAVILSSRYETVVAADISPDAVACAALTLALNRIPQRDTRAVVADVASGLPRGSFDLVVSNPPWVPTHPDAAYNYLYGDGGRTGMELPARFFDETLELLRPGGTGIVLALDTGWTGGRWPLRSRIAELRSAGCEVIVEHAPPALWGDQEAANCVEQYDGCEHAQLTAVVFRTPVAPASSGGTADCSQRPD